MSRRTVRRARLVAVTVVAAALQATPAPAAVSPPDGVITWGASAYALGESAADRGYRMVVHTSVGGRDLRVRLSNAFGHQPVTFDSVYAGRRLEGAALVRGSNRRLTFDGLSSVTVEPGATVYSDPLPGTLAAGSDLVVSLHTPDAAGPVTGHGMALQTSYATRGDHTAEESGAHWTEPISSWFYLDAVSVRTPAATGAVVALGDSITDGWQSTGDRNRRWPDYLARRLQKAHTTIKGVADEGISSNRVLSDGTAPSALNRLDRDVLSQPGVRTVFLFEGVNDLKARSGVTAADLISGYREIVDRSHDAGKCVVVSTIAPFKGWPEWNADAEAVRQEVNDFVRSHADEFDAVSDFDRVLRSPYDHERMLPVFDGGDHIHPNDKGMQAMADSVDLNSLECARR
ncbi:lysophospholipase L1-like esterase [Streptomyces sp. SAI-135]|uniref:SGNH/GDSL hydrolase family protein n=1 Tax=unclassified Streptomyces TaxID=2593676 RepID=UPI0024731EB1|nr:MULTISPECIES: SGNH/GDSL hydrolase family protein [unclassified Streptomyces]MDH6521215.1 lysophospholipase L1-like esterase [Streptomyces sp. SAI-090]MDH6614690.1 lysophospholipase L1-like esterase [Streptomyces sp. SAI-135]